MQTTTKRTVVNPQNNAFKPPAPAKRQRCPPAGGENKDPNTQVSHESAIATGNSYTVVMA